MLENVRFHSGAFLALLVFLPLLAWWGWMERRRGATLRFSAASVFARTGRGVRPHFVWLLPGLRVLSLAFAVVALARPQEEDARKRDLSVEGIDIVIALDLSTSMEAGDFRPQNRLTVAKEVLSNFIAGRVNDRIGLVVFAGTAATQAPLTLDYAVLKEVVRQLRTRVLEDGTAIGDGLSVALNRLRDSDAKSRVVVLITDGDNNAGRISPLDAAEMAKSFGVQVYTILVGKGGKVPFPAGQDLFGNTVWREMELPVNPKLLQDLSDRTGGEFYRATDRQSLERGLQKVLDRLERSKIIEGGAMATFRELYHPYLLWALLFAALELTLRHTVLRVSP